MNAVMHSLTPEFDRIIQQSLAGTAHEKLAAQVLKLSDFYLQNPGQPTPWNESFAEAA